MLLPGLIAGLILDVNAARRAARKWRRVGPGLHHDEGVLGVGRRRQPRQFSLVFAQPPQVPPRKRVDQVSAVTPAAPGQLEHAAPRYSEPRLLARLHDALAKGRAHAD